MKALVQLIDDLNMQGILEAIGDGISLQDTSFKILYQNQAHKDFVGSHIGEFCYNAYEQRDYVCEGCPVAAAFSDGKSHTTERSVPTGRGTLYFEITASPLRDSTGRIIAGVEVARDITGRKRLEASVNKQRKRIEAFFEHSITPLAFLDRDFNFLRVNRAYADEGRREISEFPGHNHFEFFPSDATVIFKEAVRTGKAFQASTRPFLFADQPERGVTYWDWILAPIQDDNGEVEFLVLSLVNVTEHKRIEIMLEESERTHRTLAENLPGIVFRVFIRENNRMKFYNKMSQLITGFLDHELAVGKVCSIDPLILTEDRSRVLHEVNQAIGEKRPFTVEYRLRHKDGNVRYLLEQGTPIYGNDGKPLYIDGVIFDITEKKKLEEQLRHAQKMEAIGQLAGGVAHDFNNILSAIIGYGHVTLMNMPDDDPLRLNIEHMMEASDRASSLTQSLLAFSRKQMMDKKPLDLNGTIKKVEKFLLRIMGEDIEAKTLLCEDKLEVLADSGQLEQVLMNLAVNARDAMPRGGAFTISTGKARIDNEFIKAYGYGVPGTYAMITAEDTGAGMSEETSHRIFEPFFTTKEAGKGTGLGLSIAYGIIKQHDGYINVYSEPGLGTTFRIYLPLMALEVKEMDVTIKMEYPERGSEVILLAEDDKTLRELNRSVLDAFGYTVIEAADGEDAVNKFMEHRDIIGLLLCDLIMPKKSGKEAYDEIRKIRPDIKVIFTSGYSPEIIQQKALLDKDMKLIFKPTSPMNLLRQIREELDKK